jgi:MFS family permease
MIAVKTTRNPGPTGAGGPVPPVRRGTVALVVLAAFGGAMATIVPMSFSLALRLEQLYPGRDELLGYVLGANAVSQLVITPVTGLLSDRTRTRWGRRHPYTVGGILLGLAATPVLVLAPDIAVLAIGWMLCSLGFGTAAGSVANFLADRLPPAQRGKVAGLTGTATQVAPVLGVLLAGAFAHVTLWVFLAPALVGTCLLLLFVLFVHEPDSRGMPVPEPLSWRRFLRSYGFDPRRSPDFAWNWLGRFVFFFGLSFASTYTTFFYASRLGVAVAEVVPVMASVSVLGAVGSTIGAVGGGWLSDRTGRRRPYTAAGALIFATACVVQSQAWSLPVLLVGGFLNATGIALFSATNQAVVLDILPDRERQAGRYMAITMFSQKVPGAIAPLVAPLLLTAGGAPGIDYTVLYLAAGALALVGGAIVVTRVREPARPS